MTPVRLEPAALRSRVKHSTTEPLRSLNLSQLKLSVQVNILLNNCKQNITSLSLLVGTTVAFFKNVCFVFAALRPKSTAMVIAGRSVHLSTLFPGQA